MTDKEEADADLAEVLLQFTNLIMNERVRAFNEGFDAGMEAENAKKGRLPEGKRPSRNSREVID